MGTANLAVSVKPTSSRLKVCIGSILIASGSTLPNIDHIFGVFGVSLNANWYLIALLSSIPIALLGALLLTFGITYVRWAKREDWLYDDTGLYDKVVCIQAFINGPNKGVHPNDVVRKTAHPIYMPRKDL
jgi:hypothetical protein